MRRNCNLDLRLYSHADHPEDSDHHHQGEEDPNGSLVQNKQQEQPHPSRQLTLMYNGKVCICDVTELQARYILMLASRETKSPTGSTLEPCSPTQLPSPPGLSMTGSLQRFLQKRKSRIQATAPYNVARQRTGGTCGFVRN